MLTPGCNRRLFCAALRRGRRRATLPAGSDPQGEFTGKNILFVHPASAEPPPSEARKEADRLLADAGAKLNWPSATQRPRPHLDDKIVTAWNGLMISAEARAYASDSADAGRILQSARRAADFIRGASVPGERTESSSARIGKAPSTVEGFADDYAFLIQGLLDLYEANFDGAASRSGRNASRQSRTSCSLDREAGGYFSARVCETTRTCSCDIKEEQRRRRTEPPVQCLPRSISRGSRPSPAAISTPSRRRQGDGGKAFGAGATARFAPLKRCR